MNRGEVWWADIPQSVGRRPVLLLTRDRAYDVLQNILVAPISRRRRGIRAEIPLGFNEGVEPESYVNLDAMQQIQKRWLLDRVGSLDRAKMREVEDAIHYALGLSY
jgi:mRNA interferase MazF